MAARSAWYKRRIVTNALADLIARIPKVELHVHIEGTLEPDMAFALAERNGVAMPYPSADALREAFEFRELQEFLDVYYSACAALLTEADFYDLTMAYMRRVAADNVVHTEIFFDPQTHTARGVEFEPIVVGIGRALDDARAELGITSELIMCFLRHLSEEDAFATLERAMPFRERIIGVGLDSGERGNPPSKFARVFGRAREHGFRAVAHAGEEGGPDYVVEALDILGVQRVDHGVRSAEDDALLQRLADARMPLTVCPLSNVRLRVFDTMADHNLRRLLERGLCVTVNSDDPAYFGGYMTDNYVAVCEALDLSATDVITLARNAAEAAFVDDARRAEILAAIDAAAS